MAAPSPPPAPAPSFALHLIEGKTSRLLCTYFCIVNKSIIQRRHTPLAVLFSLLQQRLQAVQRLSIAPSTTIARLIFTLFGQARRSSSTRSSVHYSISPLDEAALVLWSTYTIQHHTPPCIASCDCASESPQRAGHADAPFARFLVLFAISLIAISTIALGRVPRKRRLRTGPGNCWSRSICHHITLLPLRSCGQERWLPLYLSLRQSSSSKSKVNH